MKKIALTSLVALFMATGAHATDWFVGGSVGYDYFKAKGASDADTAYIIAPEIGYNLTDKFDIGLNLRYAHAEPSSYMGFSVDETTTFGAGIFARYNVVSFGNFNVLFKGTLYVDYNEGKLGGSKGDFTTFGVDIIPMVTYQLSESFSLFAELNFLGAGFETSTGDIEYTTAGFIVDSNNVARVGDIRIGFNYHF